MIPALTLDLPGRDEAREAAQRELSKSAYRAAEPPWYAKALHWVFSKLDELISQASGHVPGGPLGLLILVALVALLIAVVVVRLRPATRRGLPDALFSGADLSAADHRRQAEVLAQRGDYAGAVRERLRAVVRGLEERGVLEPRAGRTADEIAAEAGRAMPELAPALTKGTRLFDDIWYGGRTADASSYAVLVALDEQVTARRLVRA